MIANRRETLPDTGLDVELILIVLGAVGLILMLSLTMNTGRGVTLTIVGAALTMITARVWRARRAWQRESRAVRPTLLGRPVAFGMVVAIAASMVASTLVTLPDGALVVYLILTLLVGQTLETWRERRAKP